MMAGWHAKWRLSCASLLTLCLAACGGGGGGASGTSNAAGTSATSAAASTSAVTSSLQLTSIDASVATTTASPNFFMAPAVLNAPAGNVAQTPAIQRITQAMANLPTAELTPSTIHAAIAAGSASGSASVAVTTYTPAQIRAAYQMPALPSSWVNLSATQQAQMGAGQTIYIVDAYSDPNIAAELQAFSQTFGLPPCLNATIDPATILPLAAPPASTCTLSVVNATAAGGMTATTPVYDSGWATEIALDVQWAHATAPLARLVLIEAPDASISSLLGAVNLANAMGPGVVSMSFGAPEGSWTASVDSAFTNAQMTYVAATGDNGAGVEWPSVSSNVLAVGGTSLTYLGGSSRDEVVWTGTGGGISQYTAAPSYQSAAVPGLGALTMRSVADVAFNANPYTGQYVAIISPGTSSVGWYGVGGTSLATPQWAGSIAVADAIRAQNGQGVLGLSQPLLYAIAQGTGYATALNDVTFGSDGACTTCSAHAGYDQPSGLGTPNLLGLLSEVAATASTQAPIVQSITVNGTVGTTMRFSMAYSAPDPLTWTLAGAPAGMTIDATGQISWVAPVAGSYTVTVTATDTTTQLSGSAIATIVVTAPSAPVIQAATVTGQAGRPLQYQVLAQAANALQFALSGSPPNGVRISASGVLTWADPLPGQFTIVVTATDPVTGLTANATLHLAIAANETSISGPVISAAPIQGEAGQHLNAVIGISDAGERQIRINIQGAPAGMEFRASGQGIMVIWRRPVAGAYSLVITARNDARLTAQVTLPVTIR